MKKKIILIICVLVLVLMVGLVTLIVCKNSDKINYDRVYISSLDIDSRLAEYEFTPDVSNNESYKIKLKVNDNLKENIYMSLYKIEDGKEFNIQLDENLETENIDNLNKLQLKLVIYIKKSYDLLDKDYIDIGFLSINNVY